MTNQLKTLRLAWVAMWLLRIVGVMAFIVAMILGIGIGFHEDSPGVIAIFTMVGLVVGAFCLGFGQVVAAADLYLRRHSM